MSFSQIEKDLCEEAAGRLIRWLKDTMMRWDAAELGKEKLPSIIIALLVNHLAQTTLAMDRDPNRIAAMFVKNYQDIKEKLRKEGRL